MMPSSRREIHWKQGSQTQIGSGAAWVSKKGLTGRIEKKWKNYLPIFSLKLIEQNIAKMTYFFINPFFCLQASLDPLASCVFETADLKQGSQNVASERNEKWNFIQYLKIVLFF